MFPEISFWFSFWFPFLSPFLFLFCPLLCRSLGLLLDPLLDQVSRGVTIPDLSLNYTVTEIMFSRIFKGIQLSCIWLDETWQYFSFSFLSIHRLLLYVVTCVVTVQYGFDICYIVLFSLCEYFSSVRKQVSSQTLKSCDQKKDFF